MVRRDGAEIRKERMQEVARLIQRSLQNHGELKLSKTVALFQYKFGLTKEKVIEYFGVLQDLGHFVLDREHDKIVKARVKSDK